MASVGKNIKHVEPDFFSPLFKKNYDRKNIAAGVKTLVTYTD